jgi:hypothetical protein
MVDRNRDPFVRIGLGERATSAGMTDGTRLDADQPAQVSELRVPAEPETDADAQSDPLHVVSTLILHLRRRKSRWPIDPKNADQTAVL